MRQLEKFNAARLSSPINLPFVADFVTVYNPSQNVVYLRAGANDVPNSPASADLYLLPYSGRGRPVASRNFGVGVASLALPAPVFNANYPQDVEVYFTAGEPPPSVSSIALTSISSAGLLLKAQAAEPLAGPHDYPVAIPPGIRYLVLETVDTLIRDLRVFGATSGREYFRISNGTFVSAYQAGVDAPPFFPFLVDPELDSSVTVETRTTAINTGFFSLFGYQERLPYQTTQIDGRPMVEVRPPGGAGIPVVPYPEVPAAAYDVNGAAFAPAAGAVLCATPAMTAGEYLVQVEMGSADIVAAGGKYVFAVHNPAAKHVHYCPAPGHAELEWHRVSVAGGDIIQVQVGAAGAAGALYFGAIRAYKIA